MVRRLPAIALALLLVGLLLSPASTTTFIKSTVSAGWHSAQSVLNSATHR